MQGNTKVKKKCVHLGIFARKISQTTHKADVVALDGSESVDPRGNRNIPGAAVPHLEQRLNQNQDMIDISLRY